MSKLLLLSNVMIGYLCGDVLSLYDDRCIVYVGGVGYLVRLCQRFLKTLSCGDRVKIWIEHVMHEGESSLFGFQNEQEQQWFRRLVLVPGVGGRAALQILSAFSLNDLCRVLRDGRVNDLRRAEGVGPKLAQRLVTELGKRAEQEDLSPGHSFSDNPVAEDAVQALCQLGYGRVDSEKAVRQSLEGCADGDISFIISKSMTFLK